jgi:hypothetical protein
MCLIQFVTGAITVFSYPQFKSNIRSIAPNIEFVRECLLSILTAPFKHVWRNTMLDTLWTPKHTAQYLEIAEDTLSVWRCTGRVNLPYVKIGRSVRYRPEDVKAFISRSTKGNLGASEG